MKLFFAGNSTTPLADKTSFILYNLRDVLLQRVDVTEVFDPHLADVILLQEEKTTFKEFRYIDKLLDDPFISEYLTKVFTICDDDSATGLLRGVYTSMPRYRYDARYHRIVPFFRFTNRLVFTDTTEVEPVYLAGWYGNIKSNKIRKLLVDRFGREEGFNVKTSTSWYNHKQDEQKAYVELIKSAKFSLCPAGWGAPSPRIYESMAMGRCPVIIADQFAPPVGPNWKEFALFLPERNLMKLPAFLQRHEHQHKELGKKAKENWEKYFAGDLLKEYYAHSLLSLIRSTPPYGKEMEIKRWRSFSTYWKNQWTVPQRVVNKWRLLFEKEKNRIEKQ